jgi:hypothetical protein
MSPDRPLDQRNLLPTFVGVTALNPRSRSHDPNTRPAEGGRTLGRMGVPQRECADARGAKTLRRGATEATRS